MADHPTFDQIVDHARAMRSEIHAKTAAVGNLGHLDQVETQLIDEVRDLGVDLSDPAQRHALLAGLGAAHLCIAEGVTQGRPAWAAGVQLLVHLANIADLVDIDPRLEEGLNS